MSDTEAMFSEISDRVLLGRLDQPRAASVTRLAVVGDPHIATRSQGTDRVFHRTEQRLRAVIDDLNDRPVDLVLFPGDLTKDGEPWNYERIDTLLADLERPYVATPGNHDLQKAADDHDCPSAATFATRYASGSLPVQLEVGDVDLFVLNTASGPNGPYTKTHRGQVSDDQLEWLDDRLEGATTQIVASHHNPFPIVSDPLCRTDDWKTFTLRNGDRFRSILETHGVSLALSGHHHLPSLVRQNGLRQLIAPAIASYPQAYCLLEIDDTGTHIWLISNAVETGRDEAYQLAADSRPFRRTLLELTETTLENAPLLYEPPRITQPPSAELPSTKRADSDLR